MSLWVSTFLVMTSLLAPESSESLEDNPWRLGLEAGTDVSLGIIGSGYSESGESKVGVFFAPRGGVLLGYKQFYTQLRMGHQSSSSQVYLDIERRRSELQMDWGLGYAMWSTLDTTTLWIIRLGLDQQSTTFVRDNGSEFQESSTALSLQLAINKEYLIGRYFSLGWELFARFTRDFSTLEGIEQADMSPLEPATSGDRLTFGAYFFIRSYLF